MIPSNYLTVFRTLKRQSRSRGGRLFSTEPSLTRTASKPPTKSSFSAQKFNASTSSTPQKVPKLSVADLNAELASWDATLEKDKTKVANYIKSTFDFVPNDADLFVTALTDPSHEDIRLHNRPLYLVGRRFLVCLHMDSHVAETLQSNPNETVNAPREVEYNKIISDKQYPWFTILRLQRQFKLLGLEPYLRASGLRKRPEQTRMMHAEAFAEHRDKYSRATAEAMVAFMGALFVDQGEPFARKFFTERVLRYGL